LEYFTEEDYIEDKISLEGNDWTFSRHKKIDAIPTEDDIKRTISEFLSWEVADLLRR